MHKKGSMDDILNFFRVLFVIVVFFSVVFVTRAAIKQNIDISEVEANILSQRLIMSKEVNYFDNDLKRNYVGVVDLQKLKSVDFKNKILEDIFYGKVNSETSAKITLIDNSGNIMIETFYNEDLYKEKKVLVEARLIGKGAARGYTTNFYVLIQDNGKLQGGVLIIDAILPNQ